MFSTLIIFPLLPSVYFSFLYFLNLKNNKTQDIFTSLASHEPYLCMLSRSVMSNSLQPHGLQPTRLLCPWDFPGQARMLQWVAISYSNIYVYVYGSGGLVAKSCTTLCSPMDCSSPGSSVHGIFQARILEWLAISSGSILNPHLLCLLPWQAGFLLRAPPGKLKNYHMIQQSHAWAYILRKL